MSPTPSVESGVAILAQLLLGFGTGLVYFEALRRAVVLVGVRKGWLEPVALTAGRVGIAVALFAAAARIGATALLATFAGFLIARVVAVYRARRAA